MDANPSAALPSPSLPSLPSLHLPLPLSAPSQGCPPPVPPVRPLLPDLHCTRHLYLRSKGTSWPSKQCGGRLRELKLAPEIFQNPLPPPKICSIEIGKNTGCAQSVTALGAFSISPVVRWRPQSLQRDCRFHHGCAGLIGRHLCWLHCRSSKFLGLKPRPSRTALQKLC